NEENNSITEYAPGASGNATPMTTISGASTGLDAPYSITLIQTVPGPPTIGTASASDAQATVSFTAPASDGGSAITGYTATSSPGGLTGTCAASPCTVTGLINGTAYTFTVTATNGAGTGPASAASNAVTPATIPGAPTGVMAIGGNGRATVSFNPPASNGGSTITGYTVTATDITTPANGGQTVTETSSPITVTGLTNGDTYTFTVTATNGVGTGLASAASSPVIPATVPGPPTGVSATAGKGSIMVTWSAPAEDGGSPITGYRVLRGTSPGGESSTPIATIAGTSYNDGSVIAGTTYFYEVVAVTGAGTSGSSLEVSALIPLAGSTGSGFAATPNGSGYWLVH